MKRINESANTIILLLAVTVLFMFILNRWTLMLVDDYTYCFSFANNSRITSVGQIIPSMAAHYNTMNGRLITHGIVQFMLMFPGVFFDILNSAIFGLLCWLLYEFIWKIRHKEHNAVIFISVLASIWVFVPAYGEVFLWLDGSCNYLWSLTLLLLYIRPILTGWQNRINPLFWAVYIISGFIMGGLNETVSFAIIGFFVLWELNRCLLHRKKIELWRVYPALVMLLSYSYMINSPGLKRNKMGVQINAADKFIQAFTRYTAEFKWLLIFGVIMVVFLLIYQVGKEQLCQAAIWFVLSFGMNCMHSFTTSYPRRSMIGVAVFLVIADGVLLAALIEGRDETLTSNKSCSLLVYCTCAVLCLQAAVSFVPGTNDVYQAWKQMLYNEKYIQNEVNSGRLDVTIDNINSTTEYVAVHDLRYVDLENPYSWPNDAMAVYYGANLIYGR